MEEGKAVSHYQTELRALLTEVTAGTTPMKKPKLRWITRRAYLYDGDRFIGEIEEELNGRFSARAFRGGLIIGTFATEAAARRAVEEQINAKHKPVRASGNRSRKK